MKTSLGYHRNEIWMANLRETYDYIIKGKHPVLIVSNFKHILKSDTINVLVITSNISRNSKSHVAINGYGLQKESRILCEQIISLNKSDLIFKLGKVDNIKILEVNEKLKTHLALDNRHKNLGSEELEELFLRGVKEMGSIRELEVIKSEIKLLYEQEDGEYNYICKCFELIEKTKNITDRKNEFLWCGYYSLSKIYLKNEKMDEALEYAKEAIKYVDTLEIFNPIYSLSMWALARCYERTNKNKAIEIYKTLSKLYREIAEYKMRTSCIFNLAILQNNIRTANRIYRIVEKSKEKTWYYGIDKNEYLEDMKKELNIIKSV